MEHNYLRRHATTCFGTPIEIVSSAIIQPRKTGPESSILTSLGPQSHQGIGGANSQYPKDYATKYLPKMTI